jgi:copper/silver efflux system protein
VLARVLVTAPDGQRQIPLGDLARVKVATGPAMIRNEDGLLAGYVCVDVAGCDISSYVDEASRVIRQQVKLPPGPSFAPDGTRIEMNLMDANTANWDI